MAALQKYAGKLNMKEIVDSIKQKKEAQKHRGTDGEAQMDSIIKRQGDYDPSDNDDYATGGLKDLK